VQHVIGKHHIYKRIGVGIQTEVFVVMTTEAMPYINTVQKRTEGNVFTASKLVNKPTVGLTADLLCRYRFY
jgi:hypothetical protein